jgi:hypothetical protein
MSNILLSSILALSISAVPTTLGVGFLFILINLKNQLKKRPFKKRSINHSLIQKNCSMIDNIVMYWNEKAAEVLNIHTNPGDDTRRFAIFQIAIHDALNSINPKYTRYILQTEIDSSASINAAVTTAARNVLDWLINDIYWYVGVSDAFNLPRPFPPMREEWAKAWHENVREWHDEKMSSFQEAPDKIESGIRIGKDAADAITSDRDQTDRRSEVSLLSEDIINSTAPGVFQADYPIPKSDLNLDGKKKKFLTNWAYKIQPFVIGDGVDKLIPPPPYDVKSPEYATDYKNVQIKGRKNGFKIQSEIESAIIWADLRQHTLWNTFARKVVEYHFVNRNVNRSVRIDAWTLARLFALIHTAMADGVWIMFKHVYNFNRWRPKTAIRTDDGNAETQQDLDWEPYLGGVPRVPEYPSTFGILGGAIGTILERLFGDDIVVDMQTAKHTVDQSNKDLHKSGHYTVRYKRISDAVKANALTKILCGWNFKQSAEVGLELGRQIGDYVLDHKFYEPHRIIDGGLEHKVPSP